MIAKQLSVAEGPKEKLVFQQRKINLLFYMIIIFYFKCILHLVGAVVLILPPVFVILLDLFLFRVLGLVTLNGREMILRLV